MKFVSIFYKEFTNFFIIRKIKLYIEYLVYWSNLLDYKARVVEKFVEIGKREVRIFETKNISTNSSRCTFQEERERALAHASA